MNVLWKEAILTFKVYLLFFKNKQQTKRRFTNDYVYDVDDLTHVLTSAVWLCTCKVGSQVVF